jgi:PhnB protein
MGNAVKAIPEGYHSVTPYLVVVGAGKLIEFLKATFGAKEVLRMPGPGGTVGHAEMRVGDSVVMLADATEQWKAMPGKLQVYLEDVDAAYARALAAGATPILEPKDQFYGDRRGGVKDACGNEWWVATHVEDVPEEELIRRMKGAGAGA